MIFRGWGIKWFQHDTNASHDAKTKKLILRHGAEGYAVYFHCLELIAGDLTQNNITFELEHDSEIIADNLKIKGDSQEAGIDKVNRILKTIIDLGLFENDNGKVFCFKLAKRLDNTISRNADINKIKEMVDKNITTNILRSSNVAEENRLEENTIQENRLEKNKKKDNNPKYSKDHLNLAILLKNYILKENPKNKYANDNKYVDNWANDIRLMESVDHRTLEEIQDMIRWCHHDNFWKSNILSGSKLREKYDTMFVQKNRKPKQSNKDAGFQQMYEEAKQVAKKDFSKTGVIYE